MNRRRTRSAEVDEFFERTLPVIRSTLESHYRLTEREARDAEEQLLVWFRRFARRSGVTQTPIPSLKLPLLLATCRYARSFQLWRSTGPTRDRTLESVLAREPREIATELAARLDAESLR